MLGVSGAIGKVAPIDQVHENWQGTPLIPWPQLTAMQSAHRGNRRRLPASQSGFRKSSQHDRG